MSLKTRLLLLPALLCLAAPVFSGEGPFSRALSGSGLYINAGVPCELLKEYARGNCGGGRRCFSTITAACGDARLRLELAAGVKEKEAVKITASRFARVKMLYGGYIEYPGMVTSKTEVPAVLKPAYREKGPRDRETIYLPATANMAYGAGAADLVKYSAAITSRYCPAAKALWQIEVFVSTGTPAARLDSILENAVCGEPPAGAE